MSDRFTQANPDHTLDAAIAAKVTAQHSQAFREKFPNQVEICLRLVFERLQNGLHKAAAKPLTNLEVAALAQAGDLLYKITQELNAKS